MIYLKEVNYADKEKEYEAIKDMPKEENGFENKYWNVSKEEFFSRVIPELLDHSLGKNLPDEYVPDTYYFLWNDEKIVGLFKIRHYLNDFLRKGPGHIGYTILKKYRGNEYSVEGLKLAIKICENLIPEDEIYLSVHKDNIASLKTQQKCGAYIVGETDKEYLTRIKLTRKAL